MNNNHTARWMAGLALLALASTSAGVSAANAIKVAGTEAEGEPIKIGALFDLSGPTSDVGNPYADGLRDYIDWRNAEGGVGGRPIELIWQDYTYDVAIAEQLYSQYVADDVVAIQGWGTADTEALRPLITADEVPYMSASYSAELIDPEETPYNFVVATSYSDQMRIALKWIAENSDEHVEVAVFHHDSPFGESPLADGQAYIEENDLDIGYETYVMSGGATDFVGELTRARSQGASYIIVQNVSSPAAQLARDVAGMQLDATIVCLNWCGDELFIDLAGDDAEGHLTVQPFTPPTVDVPGHETPRAFLEAKGGDYVAASLHYPQAWYTMHVMAEALAELVESGEDVTGPNLKTALEELDAVDTGGVSAPIEFTAESHAGMSASPVLLVEGGEWVQVADAITP